MDLGKVKLHSSPRRDARGAALRALHWIREVAAWLSSMHKASKSSWTRVTHLTQLWGRRQQHEGLDGFEHGRQLRDSGK